MFGIGAGAWFVGGLAGAADGGQFPFQKADEFADFSRIRIADEPGSTAFAAYALDVTACFQVGEDVFEELGGDVFAFGEAGDGNNGRLQLSGDSQPDECAQRIFASFGQFHPDEIMASLRVINWELAARVDFNGVGGGNQVSEFCGATGGGGGGLAVESERAGNFLLAVAGISLNRWG